MFIAGFYNKKIRKYHDDLLVCEFCGHAGLTFSVYRQCAHIFWIPIVPAGHKTVQCTCDNCGSECAGGGKSGQYLSAAATPAYMFSVLIFFVVFIVFASVMNAVNGKKKAGYINNPEAGDIYLIRDHGGDRLKYYFFKVKEVTGESVIIYHGAVEYPRFVSRMADDDYFVVNDEIEIFKEDLKEYLDEGVINYVKRGGGNSGNFINESESR